MYSPKTLAGLAYSLFCYLVFSFSFLYLIGFVGRLAVPKHIDSGLLIPWPLAALVDTLLILMFGVQHSGMARSTFKRWITRFVPIASERSTYVLLSSVVLLVMFWLWQPMLSVVWSVEAPWASLLLIALFWAGWGIAALSTMLINHLELFGLAQALGRFRGGAQRMPTFQTPLLYKVVRHPLYLGFLLALWSTPVMTSGHLLFAAGLSAYIFVGIFFEEKDLVTLFGERYRQYQRAVSMIVPLPRRTPRKEDRE
jgi:methanethiol S-methyltransferase